MGALARVITLTHALTTEPTFLYRLSVDEEIGQTVPTIGFNVETLVYKNLKFQVWDLGGQSVRFACPFSRFPGRVPVPHTPQKPKANSNTKSRCTQRTVHPAVLAMLL